MGISKEKNHMILTRSENRENGQTRVWDLWLVACLLFWVLHLVAVWFCAKHSISSAWFLIWEMRLVLPTSLFCGENEKEFLAQSRHPGKVSFVPWWCLMHKILSSQANQVPSKTRTTVRLQETVSVAWHLLQCSFYSPSQPKIGLIFHSSLNFPFPGPASFFSLWQTTCFPLRSFALIFSSEVLFTQEQPWLTLLASSSSHQIRKPHAFKSEVFLLAARDKENKYEL